MRNEVNGFASDDPGSAVFRLQAFVLCFYNTRMLFADQTQLTTYVAVVYISAVFDKFALGLSLVSSFDSEYALLATMSLCISQLLYDPWIPPTIKKGLQLVKKITEQFLDSLQLVYSFSIVYSPQLIVHSFYSPQFLQSIVSRQFIVHSFLTVYSPLLIDSPQFLQSIVSRQFIVHSFLIVYSFLTVYSPLLIDSPQFLQSIVYRQFIVHSFSIQLVAFTRFFFRENFSPRYRIIDGGTRIRCFVITSYYSMVVLPVLCLCQLYFYLATIFINGIATLAKNSNSKQLQFVKVENCVQLVVLEIFTTRPFSSVCLMLDL